MKVKGWRIDDRYIHGQITTAWTRTLGVTFILIVSDQVKNDPTQEMVMQFAAPQGVRVQVLSVSEAPARIRDDAGDALVIFGNPSDVLALVNAGVQIDNLVIGNMKYTKGKHQILHTVSVDDKDLQTLRSLLALRVRLTVQQVPESAATDLSSYLED